MPTNIIVRTDLEKLIKDLDDLTKKELPFATARALTKTAQEVRDKLRGQLDEHFTTRNKWVERSIQIDAANKRDHEPVARVGSLYEPMSDHVEGGTKEGKDGRSVGIPVWARPTAEDRTRPSQFPGKLAEKSAFFVAPFSRGDFKVGAGVSSPDGVGVFQRLGKYRKKRKPKPVEGASTVPKKKRKPAKDGEKRDARRLRLWWVLEDEVKIKDDWPFEEEGTSVVEQRLIDLFWQSLEEARATSKGTTAEIRAAMRQGRGVLRATERAAMKAAK